MVPPEARLDKVHLDEHERPRDEEQRELTALVAQRIAALVTYDGVHHRETCTEPAHKTLDEHEPGDDARDGRGLDIDGEGRLVADSGLVFLRLEKEDADGQVKQANAYENGFAVGNAGHEERTQRDKEG